jgi:hypothetical protein
VPLELLGAAIRLVTVFGEGASAGGRHRVVSTQPARPLTEWSGHERPKCSFESPRTSRRPFQLNPTTMAGLIAYHST